MPMKKGKKNRFVNENGLTLVEVLASIVILSIILVSILMILLQSMKAKQTSEEIIDATYIAQTEMEFLYDLSRQDGNHIEEIINRGYTELPDDEVFISETDEGFEVEITLTTPSENNLSDMKRVIVKVYDQENLEKPKAQMENLFEWGADDNEEAAP